MAALTLRPQGVERLRGAGPDLHLGQRQPLLLLHHCHEASSGRLVVVRRNELKDACEPRSRHTARELEASRRPFPRAAAGAGAIRSPASWGHPMRERMRPKSSAPCSVSVPSMSNTTARTQAGRPAAIALDAFPASPGPTTPTALAIRLPACSAAGHSVARAGARVGRSVELLRHSLLLCLPGASAGHSCPHPEPSHAGGPRLPVLFCCAAV